VPLVGKPKLAGSRSRRERSLLSFQRPALLETA
jgi:hypothetical protein